MEKIKIIKTEEILMQEFNIYGTIDNPIFLARDVAKWLEHSDPRKMINTIDDEEKLTGTLFHSGQNREMWFVTEDGLYEILMQSRKPIAKQFKKEVKKILKSIRKNGGYINNQENLSEAEILANAMLVAQNVINTQKSQIHTLETKIELDKHKVIFAEAVSGSEDSILIGQLAKLITQNGYEIGQKRLFQWLRDNNYIMKHKNEPYQKYIENGMFTLKEGSFSTPMAGTRLTLTTKVTPKGQSYFINKFSEMLVGV